MNYDFHFLDWNSNIKNALFSFYFTNQTFKIAFQNYFGIIGIGKLNLTLLVVSLTFVVIPHRRYW